jgi:hypothetical protein
MTTRAFAFNVESCAFHSGRLRISSGAVALHPTTYTPEHVCTLRQLLADRVGAVAHIELTNTSIAIVSVEAAEAEPVCNCQGGVA